jgi:hypothetical protein
MKFDEINDRYMEHLEKLDDYKSIVRRRINERISLNEIDEKHNRSSIKHSETLRGSHGKPVGMTTYSNDKILKNDPAFIKLMEIYDAGNLCYSQAYSIACGWSHPSDKSLWNKAHDFTRDYWRNTFHKSIAQPLSELAHRFVNREIGQEEYNNMLEGKHPVILEARGAVEKLKVFHGHGLDSFDPRYIEEIKEKYGTLNFF